MAVCNGGGGGELVEIALSLGVDVYISGDLKHHEINALKANDNIDFIEIRHFDCERIITEIFKDRLLSKFGNDIEVVISSAEASPLVDTDNIL